MKSPEDIEAEQYLLDIERAENDLMQVCKDSMFENSPITYTSFYLYGIVNRALYQSKAFRMMVQECNSHVASALIRLQLDTVMRLYALFWVKDPEDFSQKVYTGTPINKLTCAHGKKLTDVYLRQKLEYKNPWVHSVYKSANGYIHFSAKHIFSGLEMQDEKTGKVRLAIGSQDREKSIGYYRELTAAFCHIIMMLVPALVDLFDEMWKRLGVQHTNKWIDELNEERRKAGLI